VSYRFEWISGPVFLGTVLVLLIVPPFALIGLVVVALAALAALVALAGAVLATPYLLVRSLRRRLAERRRSTEGSVPIAASLHGPAAPPRSRASQPSPTQLQQGDHSESLSPTRSRHGCPRDGSRGGRPADAPRAPSSTPKRGDSQRKNEARAILRVAQSFADELVIANPRFDRLRFIEDVTEDPS